MIHLSGMHEVRVDERSRVAIPVRFLDAIRALSGDEFANPDTPLEVIVGLDMNARVSVFPKSIHAELVEYLNSQNRFDVTKSGLRVALIGSAEPFVLDRQNRIRIPSLLGDRHQLKGDIVIMGAGDHLQLLSKQQWERDMARIEGWVEAQQSGGFGEGPSGSLS